MDPVAIATSAAVLGGLGLAFGGLIAAAHRTLHVQEDPRIEAVAERLPGANCGACGEAGCRAFAEALVAGRVQPSTCTVMNPEEAADVAALLGMEVGTRTRRVARLLCAGGADVAVRRADYVGLPTCRAAAVVAGGGVACAWACLGHGDCADACDFDAIAMGPRGLPLVDPARCTACGDCVETCPRDLFVLLPEDQKLLVQCRSRLEGEAAEALCGVACTGCGKCVQDAAPGLIEVVDGLAEIDPAKLDRADPDATRRCPTGAIVWLEDGVQRSLAGPRPDARPRRAAA